MVIYTFLQILKIGFFGKKNIGNIVHTAKYGIITYAGKICMTLEYVSNFFNGNMISKMNLAQQY